MVDGAIDSLSIEIGASSTKAVNGIKKLTEVLQNLKDAMKGEGGETFDKLKKFADAMNGLRDASNIKLNSKLPDQLRNIGKAVSEVSDDTIRKLNEMTAAIDRLRGIDLKGFSSAVKAAQKASKQVTALQAVPSQSKGAGLVATGPVSDKDISDMFNRDFGRKSTSSSVQTTNLLKKELQLVGKIIKSNIGPAAKIFANALKNAAGYAKRIAKSILSFAGKTIKGIWDKSAFAGLEKSLSRIKNVINSFSRIAFYRAIRSAIKYVTDALKEGVENAYHYASEFGSATKYIAEAYDRISGSEFKMSNQLGAAWATLIAYIEPIIVQIINLVTRAADAITQFFALLSGKGTYLKAVDYNKKWAESAGGAAKAAKEWKNQLMGFDEINRLEEPSDPSGSGGGSSTPDYGSMFEEAPVNDFFKEIREAFENGEWARLGVLLGEKFNEIVNKIDWKGYGEKIGKGLQASITVAYNFLKTADFKNLGARISEFINNAMANVDFTQLGRLRMRLRTALWDVIYGVVVNLDWKEVAINLSNFILGSLSELADWLETLDPVEIATALKDFFGNIKYEEIYEKLKEVLKKAFDLLGDIVAELLPEDLGINVKDGIVNAIKETDFAAIHNVLSYQLDKAVFGEKWANFWWSRGDYAGKEIVMGIIKGTDSEKESLSESLRHNINEPVDGTFQSCKDMYQEYANGYSGFVSDIDGMNGDIQASTFGLRDSVTGTMSDVGTAIDGVSGAAWSMAQNGSNAIGELDNAIYYSGQNMVTNLNTIRDAAAETWSWLKAVGDRGQARIDANGGIWNSLGGFASGGFPEDGLFMANHSELVGRFTNGRTAVANNEMIVEGISAGVFDAVVSAFSQTGGSNVDDRPINIYLDGRQIAQSTTRYQTQFARASGA